jgi:hypothetical protein
MISAPGEATGRWGDFAVPDFVRKLPKCAGFWQSAVPDLTTLSDLSILKKSDFTVIYAAGGE